jgi:hypothetical protein
MKALRIILVLLALGMTGYGLLAERHSVQSLSGGEDQQVGGPAFVEGTTSDQFALHDGKVVAPLSPVANKQKDCKT